MFVYSFMLAGWLCGAGRRVYVVQAVTDNMSHSLNSLKGVIHGLHVLLRGYFQF